MLFRPIGQDRVPTSIAENGPHLVTGNSWYSLQQLNDAPTTSANTTGVYAPGYGPRLQLGNVWQDTDTGNAFMYVQAAAALTAGQLVSLELPTAGTVTAAGSTVSDVITNITTTFNEVGNYFWTLDAAGTSPSSWKQNLRLIKASTIGATATITVAVRSELTTANVKDADVLPSVPTNGSACAIIRPFRVIVCTATSVPIGVCLGTVTSGNYTIVQVAGLALVSAFGTGTALAPGVPANLAAAGQIIGSAAVIAYTVSASIIPLVTYAGASALVPCYVNFLGT